MSIATPKRGNNHTKKHPPPKGSERSKQTPTRRKETTDEHQPNKLTTPDTNQPIHQTMNKPADARTILA
ncbi:hypothetical protein M3148_17595, partial [Georgenia satyanarayanai]|uniref:hypothetical protein n=1 Tax=Georgenia satyanarayanai TaxID=860221 RepID=UPI00203C960C